MNISRRRLLLSAGAIVVVAGGSTLTPMIRREGTFVATPSRIPYVTPTEGELPKTADAVIIGGGLQGIMTAINLKEKGLNVVICEKGVIGGEQSGRAYSQIISYLTPPSVFVLHQYGKLQWSKMNEKIGKDTSYRIQGRVQAHTSDKEIEEAREWIQSRSKNTLFNTPLHTRMIEGKELSNRLVGGQTTWKIAGFEEDAGSLDPEIVTPTMAEYAKSIGIKIYTHCAVRGFETSAGKISDVVTEKGIIRTSRVALIGGIWSRLFMGNYGVNIPTLNVYLSQQIISGVPGAPRGNVHLPNGIHFREQSNGTYAVAPRIFTASIVKDSFLLGSRFIHLLGGHELPLEFSIGKDLFNSFMMKTSWKLDEKTPFEELRTATNTPNIKHLDQVLERLKKEYPVFNDSKVLERWGGTVSPTDDEIPIISYVDRFPGLVITTATGWGMTESPASGRLTAEMLLGETPFVDPTPYSLARFNA